MKKRIFSLILILFLSSGVFASDLPKLKYKHLELKDKISYDSTNGKWTDKFDKKQNLYFIKAKGFGNFYDYIYPNKDFAFTTNCEFEFINDGKLIGYSNSDLKFYDMKLSDGKILKKALTKQEVEVLFPDYAIINISEFSKITGAYKIRKNVGTLKIILFNDTDKTFQNYNFASGNAEFNQFDLKGFIHITKPGMIQFSQDGEHIAGKNFFVLLVR